jgi:hypothetical protein
LLPQELLEGDALEVSKVIKSVQARIAVVHHVRVRADDKRHQDRVLDPVGVGEDLGPHRERGNTVRRRRRGRHRLPRFVHEAQRQTEGGI